MKLLGNSDYFHIYHDLEAFSISFSPCQRKEFFGGQEHNFRWFALLSASRILPCNDLANQGAGNQITENTPVWENGYVGVPSGKAVV